MGKLAGYNERASTFEIIDILSMYEGQGDGSCMGRSNKREIEQNPTRWSMCIPLPDRVRLVLMISRGDTQKILHFV